LPARGLLFLILLRAASAGVAVPATGIMQLPAGTVEITAELLLPRGAHDLEVRGDPAGTVLKMSNHFQGRALFVTEAGRHIRFLNFTIDGNREALEQRAGLPPSDVPFARFTRNNGILVEGADGLEVAGLQFRNIAGFAVLVSRSQHVRVEHVRVENSGSRNAKGRNNTTGGILFEEATAGFQAKGNVLEDVRGNGIWTHSLYTSARNSDGEISDNQFHNIGRDAIQAGHATRMTVERNSGSRIGYPAEIVDVENQGIPAALDTSGDVDRSVYTGNRFEQISGKCIDLDGFHDGEVRGNTCIGMGNYGIVMNNTNPDMRSEKIRIVDNLIDGGAYGGIFVIGTDHVIERNRLLNLNTSHSMQELLRAGIYLGKGAERPAPARGNTIRDNQISGYDLTGRCVAAAAGVNIEDNRVARNVCSGGR
jgi:hypothetical protein